jgi:competence CoiA-like predicted nuclease
MNFAINDNGQRIKAFPDGRAYCPNCNSIVIAKCGDLNIWHWAHDNLLSCDSWNYEPKTKWHIDWQNNFSEEQTEVYITRGDQAHRADILTTSQVVIEIQNSKISTTEIEERERFYKKMIWVINSEEFKQNITLTRFYFEFTKEVFFHFINPIPEFENAAYSVKIPLDDYNGQIKKALQTCKYKKQCTNKLKEDDEEENDEECIWYNKKVSFNQPLEKEVSNAFHSYLLDRQMIHTLEDFKTYDTKFKWKNFRKTWLTAEMPIFIDLNNRFLLWIVTIYENGNGFGKIVSKRKFLQKYKK